MMGSNPSWAGDALARLDLAAESDPRRDGFDLGDLSEIRLVADHDGGGLYLLAMGREGPLPFISWRIRREFVDELLRPESSAIVLARLGRPGATLVTSPDEPPRFLAQQRNEPIGGTG